MEDLWRGGVVGGVHALSASDHLSALLPAAVGRGCGPATTLGLRWGLGHGVGAILVGFVALTLRGVVDVAALSRFLELAVGVTLVLIGLGGVKESLEALAGNADKAGDEEDDAAGKEPSRLWQSLQAWVPGLGAARGRGPAAMLTTRATLYTGVLHGVSGTGHAVGVLPAIMLPSALRCGAYLAGFSLGTALAMAAYTGTVGACTLAWARTEPHGDAAREGAGSPTGAAHRDARLKPMDRRLGYLSLAAGLVALVTGVVYIVSWVAEAM